MAYRTALRSKGHQFRDSDLLYVYCHCFCASKVPILLLEFKIINTIHQIDISVIPNLLSTFFVQSIARESMLTSSCWLELTLNSLVFSGVITTNW